MAQKIKVYSFGRARKEPFTDEVDRFCKMSSTWANIEFKMLKGVDAQNESPEVALNREAVILEKQWGSNSYIVSLAEEGKMMTSQEFARFVESVVGSGKELVFNIGSAYGLSDVVKKQSHKLLSLSPMTFPYKLCRVIFAEQLYRALAINHNHPYHKE